MLIFHPEKVRGRNRITGNPSVRSRPLAPSLPPTRIATASDVPRGAANEKRQGGQLVAVPLTRVAIRFDRRVVSDNLALAISYDKIAKLACCDKRTSVYRRFFLR